MTEYRAHLDARIEFVNGGSLTAESFRLDLPSAESDEHEIARLLVQHLGLTLVDSVRFSSLEIAAEQHRGSRGIEQHEDAGRSPSTSVIVDLSHSIREGVITYPGLPGPRIEPHLTRERSRAHYAPGTEFAIDSITMVGNTGTYLDSPFHRYPGAVDLAGLDLTTLVDLPAQVFHLADATSRGVPAATFYDRDVRGCAVLLHTGWDRHFGTPEYANDAPFLSEAGAAHLVAEGAVLVGIDSLNMDDTGSASGGLRPAHSRLLEAGIPVVEHLTNLDRLPARGAWFTAVPPKIESFGTFPVRAFAVVGR